MAVTPSTGSDEQRRPRPPDAPLFFKARCGPRGRLGAALVAAASLALLVAARRLSPAPSGAGTHTQLGLAPCLAPQRWGIPCPTCGVTTAFVHAARGELFAALRVQPVGLLAAALLSGSAVACGVVVVTGRRWVVNWLRLSLMRMTIATVAVVLLAWVYKIAVFRAGGP